MRYYKLVGAGGEPRLAVETADGVLADLTSLNEDLTEIDEVGLAASLSGLEIDVVVERLLNSGRPDTYDLSKIVEDSRAGIGEIQLDIPFEPPEVWAAGVTYKRSENERQRESAAPDVYAKVYSAARPEIFLKATTDRCVGPFESVGIRSDSDWNVPEAELAFVIYQGEIIGYTVGNDMSSRSIEGENPLYLPQAKLYDRCCSIGPCLVTTSSLGNPHNLAVRCTVNRSGSQVFSGDSSTALLSRKCQELADWLHRQNVVPNMTTLLTGTGIVPPPEFTLQEGDIVAISIEGIGTLENDVVLV